MSPRSALIALLMTVMAACAGCGSTTEDKAGGTRPGHPLVLTLASGNDQPLEVQAFADAVARESHGTLRIRFRNAWRRGRADYEHALIGDVRAGRADLGWVGARAWDDVGVRSLDALGAPFLVDDYALEQRVVASPLMTSMLAGIRRVGLEPIGALPGPMRRLLGAGRPLAAPADFRGRAIGFQASAVAEQTLRALGARGVPLSSGGSIARLGGIEQHLGSVVGNHYWDTARYLTENVGLWPRTVVLFAGPHGLARLSGAQREVLRRAARAAAPAALATVRAGDAAAVPQLCDHAVRFVTATGADVAALRRAVAPVYADLERSRFTRDAITAIQAMRRAVPVSAAPVPRCGRRASAPSGSALPDGTYVTTRTAADARRGHLPPGDDLYRGGVQHFTMRLSHGRVVMHERVRGVPDSVGFEGRYTVYRDRVRVVASDGIGFTARWGFDGHRLRFTDFTASFPGDAVVWGAHAWTKVGR